MNKLRIKLETSYGLAIFSIVDIYIVTGLRITLPKKCLTHIVTLYEDSKDIKITPHYLDDEDSEFCEVELAINTVNSITFL